MSLRNWTLGHTYGLLLGIITPLLVVPLLLLLFSWVQDYDYSYLWHKLTANGPYRIKIITLSIIANLFWFYFFLNRSKWGFAMGVILGSIAYAPYIIYIKFF